MKFLIGLLMVTGLAFTMSAQAATIANLASYKVVSAYGAPVKDEVFEMVYDFSKDAGAVGQYPIFKSDVAAIVEKVEMHVDTLCTSGGAATVGVGKAADLAGQVAATAVASLTAGAVIFGVAQDSSHVLAAGDIVYMDIAAAALTAGKIRFVVHLKKF